VVYEDSLRPDDPSVWSGTKHAEQACKSFIAIEGRSHIKLDASTPTILPRSWTMPEGLDADRSAEADAGEVLG
jgi:hypothetical protein